MDELKIVYGPPPSDQSTLTVEDDGDETEITFQERKKR